MDYFTKPANNFRGLMNLLNYCIRLAENGALIVCENVLANGSAADENTEPKRHSEFV